MASVAAIVMPTLFLENENLVGLCLRHDFGRDGQPLGLAFAGEKDIAQDNGITGFSGKLFNGDFVSGGNAVLLSASAHDCEHG
jgi:hypothetical protein